jgi:hypothetical protein
MDESLSCQLQGESEELGWVPRLGLHDMDIMPLQAVSFCDQYPGPIYSLFSNVFSPKMVKMVGGRF